MNVLLATDGSQDAWAASAWLSKLPFQGDHLDVLTVLRHPLPENANGPGAVDLEQIHGARDESVYEDTLEMAEGLKSIFREVRTHVRCGDAIRQILTAAQCTGTDLLVLGHPAHPATESRLLGSVARGVLASAECPVLLVRPEWSIPRRVVLAYDGSPAAQAGLEALLRLPLPEDASVTVVCVAESVPPVAPLADAYGGDTYVTSGYYEGREAEEAWRMTAAAENAAEAAARIEGKGWKTIRSMPCRKAADAILAAAEGADLIVLGAHTRREWLGEVFLGNTALEVLHNAECAVLVGKPLVRRSV